MKQDKVRNFIQKVFFFSLIIYLSCSFLSLNSQETLKYKVSVDVMVVPVFAVDGRGNPVYDLKQEELKLIINDKPVKILDFRRFQFTQETKVKEKIESDGKGLPSESTQEQDRVLFVILDTMFNSLTGFRRGKEIAINLVNDGLPGDKFVVLENNPIGGLKYIGGSDKETDIKSLIKKIKKIEAPPEKWSRDMYADRLLDSDITRGGITDPRLESSRWETLRQLHIDSEKYRYKHQIRYFARVLSQFKYALKTIDKPKIVFFISEGIAKAAFRASLYRVETQAASGAPSQGGQGKGFTSILTKDEKTSDQQDRVYSSFMLKYLVDIVKSINKGGSVLYTINPRYGDDINDRNASGEMSLRYLASESGGKYFAGSKPAKIIERIKKTTAAYYEIFYTVQPDMGNNMNIRIECQRSGINIHSLIHTESNRPYNRMEAVQKKLFALNVANNGNWSRIVGKVMKVKYKNNKRGDRYNLQIPLPKVMQNQKLDIFSIRMDPKTQKTAIDVISRDVKTFLNLNIKKQKGKKQFFVVIEPQTPYCIYNAF
jgi:hypothetical protein